MIVSPADDYSRFLALSITGLGTLTGILIGIPMAASIPSGPLKFLVVILSGILGARIGYRQRKHHGFLYFLLICVLVLSSVLYAELR